MLKSCPRAYVVRKAQRDAGAPVAADGKGRGCPHWVTSQSVSIQPTETPRRWVSGKPSVRPPGGHSGRPRALWGCGRAALGAERRHRGINGPGGVFNAPGPGGEVNGSPAIPPSAPCVWPLVPGGDCEAALAACGVRGRRRAVAVCAGPSAVCRSHTACSGPLLVLGAFPAASLLGDLAEIRKMATVRSLDSRAALFRRTRAASPLS